MAKTPGQVAYELELRARPAYAYADGTARKPWDQLCEIARWSWERNPTPRWFNDPAHLGHLAKPKVRVKAIADPSIVEMLSLLKGAE